MGVLSQYRCIENYIFRLFWRSRVRRQEYPISGLVRDRAVHGKATVGTNQEGHDKVTPPPLRTHPEQCLTSGPDVAVRLIHVNYRRKGRCNIQPEGLFQAEKTQVV